MEELKKTWALAKEDIRPQLSPVTYHRWIEALEPVTVQSGILILQAADEYRETAGRMVTFEYTLLAGVKD